MWMEYKITVRKGVFVFSSVILQSLKISGQYINICIKVKMSVMCLVLWQLYNVFQFRGVIITEYEKPAWWHKHICRFCLKCWIWGSHSHEECYLLECMQCSPVELTSWSNILPASSGLNSKPSKLQLVSCSEVGGSIFLQNFN